ncbi:Hypothetical protein TES1_1359 [Thermococcus paralvinellae]|uniref:Uncharacterized protein n=2 Tax=Thermococcus paralvinellae TaxID=582419 RepID=W0I7K6_9EURY|nr:Hypothetical protein TES1_1359 [Thermococcus paralvinellae]
MEKVFEEIERRIKRLEAEIELAEKRLKLLEETGAAYKYQIWEKRESYLEYYLVFAVIWIMMGLMLVLYIKNKYVQRITPPLTPYLILALVLIFLPLIYMLWDFMHKEEIENSLEYLNKKEKNAQIVLNEFYRPLKEALEKGDEEKLCYIADNLLTSPRLAKAIEETNEGDPKVMAYALYLYLNRDKDIKDEIEKTVKILRNKPLKVLLSFLLERD